MRHAPSSARAEDPAVSTGPSSSDRFHLRGLDGLRGIAAVAVLATHVEVIKGNAGLPNHAEQMAYLGDNALVLFFVLSGFLITSLLLRERDRTHVISLKHFYARRILRVWPLYYLVLAVSALAFSYMPPPSTLLLCVTVFPNIAHALAIDWAVSPQIWSIGVEEQFYLFWPAAMRLRGTPLRLVIIVMLMMPLYPHVLQFALARIAPNPQAAYLIQKVCAALPFNCMAVGACMALISRTRSERLSPLLANPVVSLLLVALPFCCWFSNVSVHWLNPEFYSLMFGGLILTLSAGHRVALFETPAIRFLGRISYGIYMYHWIVLRLIVPSVSAGVREGRISSSVLLYGGGFALTVLVSAASYYLLERPLLALKERFA